MPDMTPARIRLALAWTTVGPNQLFPVGLAERGVLLRQGALLAHASSVRAASPSRRTIDGGGNPHRPRVEFRVPGSLGHFLAGLAISSLAGTQVRPSPKETWQPCQTATTLCPAGFQSGPRRNWILACESLDSRNDRWKRAPDHHTERNCPIGAFGLWLFSPR